MAEFRIGDRSFRTKGAAISAVREVLRRTPVGSWLDGDDLSLIRALVEMHPRTEEKLAGGCIGIVVRTNKVQGTPAYGGFYVIHDDGSETDFSIYAPFETKAQSELYDLGAAARRAVSSTTADFKRRAFATGIDIRCAVSGVVLEWDDAVVDHSGSWPFSRILAEWSIGRGKIELVGRIGREFARDKDRADFVRFHDERAVLRIIHRRVNSSLGNRG